MIDNIQAKTQKKASAKAIEAALRWCKTEVSFPSDQKEVEALTTVIDTCRLDSDGNPVLDTFPKPKNAQKRLSVPATSHSTTTKTATNVATIIGKPKVTPKPIADPLSNAIIKSITDVY
jgi:hypothetical protein